MEAGESINPSEITKTESDIIKSRFEQSNASKLSEYVTGLKIDDPKFIDKLEEDQKNIREKYNLPKREDRFDTPYEYEKYLRNLAKENGIKVVKKSEYDEQYKNGYFENSLLAGAVYDGENKVIAIDINSSDENSYIKSLIAFEHETIHSLQDKNFPEMEIEKQEYEAYVANWNIYYSKRNPGSVELFFDFSVVSSINRWYKEESKEKGEELKAKWKDPEYFLKSVDGISQDKIENYKTKQQNFDIQK